MLKTMILNFVSLLVVVFQAQAGLDARNGDCFPEQFNLPQRGQGCVFVSEFQSQADAIVYQLWTCEQGESSKNYLMKFADYRGASSEFQGCRVFKKIMPSL